MKLTTLFAASSLALAGISGWYLSSGEELRAEYQPRTKSPDGSFLDAVDYLRILRGNIETGNFEVSDQMEMAAAVADFDRRHEGERSVDMSWWELGPNNVGGRTRAILAVTDQLIFAGSVTGGLYKSVNGGNNWTRVEVLDSFGKTMAISCIDQTGDGTIYIGTGSQFEQNFGGDGGSAALGVGLFRSTDLGVTWELVPGTEPTPFNNGANWAYINEMAADPNVPSRIWIVGTMGNGYYDPNSGGLNFDVDGLPNTAGHDVKWAVDGSYCLIGVANGRVYKSVNGNSFSQVGSGLLQNKQRVRVAISPDDVNKAYVLYAQGGFMGGLYYTADAGSNWELKWPSGTDDIFSVFGTNGQAYYDLALIVKPGDPGTCWVGGVTLWQAGANNQPEQIAFNFDFGSSELYVHSDIHTFEIAPNGDWYIGCDGGIFKSVNNGQTYTAMNRGYITTQYYGIGFSGGYSVIGGTQDNGTHIIPGMTDETSLETDSWQQGIQIQGGDGFRCDLSNVTVPDVSAGFATSQFGALSRYNAQGSGGPFYDNEIINVAGDDFEIGPFYSIIRLYENTDDEDSQQNVILFNNRNTDLFSYEEDGEVIWLDTALFTQNMTLPFAYRFPLGDTLNFWPELVRPDIWSTEELTVDPNYPWLEPQDLTSTVDSCITTEILVGFETVIDQIIEETVWVYWTDSVFVPEIDDYYVFSDSTEIVLDTDTTYIDVPIYETETICTTWYFYASDVLNNVREQWLVQDPFTSMLVAGFTGSEGIWITRQALNFNVSPDWWKINNAPTTSVRAFEFSRDGKTLFYSSWGGQLFRVDNLHLLWSAENVEDLVITQIASNAGSAITSIAQDPNNPNHLVYTVGGYGQLTGGKVRESFNAMSASPTFTNIWDFSGDDAVLERMPVFASVIDVSDPSGNTIVVGTEFGIWATNDGGDSWNHTSGVSDGIPSYPEAGPSAGTLKYTPVFDLRQQQTGIRPYMNPTNYGTIFAGTHGRGIWRSDDFFSVDVAENDIPEVNQTSLLIYPNPTMDEAYIDIKLRESVTHADIQIFSVTGQMVRQIRTNQLSAGTHKIALEAQELAAGNYVVRYIAGSSSGSGKLVKR
ncbi:MAG: T9SS type A sorting domain-containing protein [Flavobacteriales bacterium]|jgi:hypothetical protein